MDILPQPRPSPRRGAPRAAVYARKSAGSPHAQTFSSLDTQIRDGMLAAMRDGCRFAGVYAEVADRLSYARRPELTRLRQAIRGGEVDVVYAWDATRLGGDGLQALALHEEAREHGCVFRFVHGEEQEARLAALLREALRDR